MSSGLDGLIIYQKVYDLILYALPIINRFPKSQRFVLGQQIENGLIDLSTMIVQANKTKNKIFPKGMKKLRVRTDNVCRINSAFG